METTTMTNPTTTPTYAEPSDKPTLFESVVCSRCGGSGHYSYNAMTGSRCFKCSGRGRTLTTRGSTAQAFFTASLTAPASEFAVGDRFLAEGIPGFTSSKWIDITAVTPVTAEQAPNGIAAVLFTDARGERHGYNADYALRRAFSAEAKRPLVAAALAFQATLTKTGSVRKRG